MKYQLLKDGQYITVVSTRTDVPAVKQVDVTTAVSQLTVSYSMGMLGVELSIRVPPIANYEPQRAARAAILEVADTYRRSTQRYMITVAEGLERFIPVVTMELQNLTHVGSVYLGIADAENPPGARIRDEGVVIYLDQASYSDPDTVARDVFMATYQAKMLKA